MKKTIRLAPPLMPNFLFAEQSISQKVNGENKIQIPVSDLDESEAEEFGQLMKEEFIRHWKKKTTNKP